MSAMQAEISSPKTGETSWLWLAKLVTGVLVIVLLFVHLIVNHLVAPNGLLSYREVAEYLALPGIAIMESTFLVVVIAHALLATRSVLLDLKPSRAALSGINWSFLAIGIGATVYGIWLLQVIVQRGTGG
jgi:succinate dehydrogenase hydrophobic anchor subunit